MSSPAEISFSKAARCYRQYAGVQTAMADWLAEWAPEERSGAALEIGAGTGLLTERLLPWKGSYVATDVSPQMCAEGRREFPQVEWQTTSAEAALAGPWDWIFSSSMAQWLEDPAAVFKTWKRHLSPEGRIVAGLFVAGSLPELRALTAGWAPLTWRAPAEWERALHAAGLTLVRSETVERVFWYPSALELLRSLHRVGASPVRRYNAGELMKVLARYEAQFRKETQVKSTWKFYRFEARGNAPGF